jgi:hypothetical protein
MTTTTYYSRSVPHDSSTPLELDLPLELLRFSLKWLCYDIIMGALL